MGRRQLKYLQSLILVTLILLLLACGQSSDETVQTAKSELYSDPTEYYIHTPVSDITILCMEPIEGEYDCNGGLTGGTLTIDKGYLILSHGNIVGDIPIWPPNYNLKSDNGSVQIVDENGSLVAYIGEEVCMGGGQGSIEYIEERTSGNYSAHPWFVCKDSVRKNLIGSSEYFTLSTIDLASYPSYVFNKKPLLDSWFSDDSSLTGVFSASNKSGVYKRCPEITFENTPKTYVPIWPPEYYAQIKDGELEIVDGLGDTVVRDGDQVTLKGNELNRADKEKYWQLSEELPCICTGPYWIVDD